MSSILPLPENPAPLESFSFGGYGEQSGKLRGSGFWPRAGARIIDLIVHFCISLFTALLMGFLVAIAAAATHAPAMLLIHKMTASGVSAFVLAIIGALAYHTVCDSVSGSTMGKLIFSMVVVQEDGSPCGFKSALIRNLAYYVDGLFFGLIGYSAMKRDEAQQRYGDEWAHTIVCKRSDIAPEKLRSGGRFALGFLLACMADASILIVSMLIRLMA